MHPWKPLIYRKFIVLYRRWQSLLLYVGILWFFSTSEFYLYDATAIESTKYRKLPTIASFIAYPLSPAHNTARSHAYDYEWGWGGMVVLLVVQPKRNNPTHSPTRSLPIAKLLAHVELRCTLSPWLSVLVVSCKINIIWRNTVPWNKPILLFS